jgi:hypothetical protein
MKRKTIKDISVMKKAGKKISMLTAYDYFSAKLIDQAGVDIILVGDSLGMVIQVDILPARSLTLTNEDSLKELSPKFSFVLRNDNFGIRSSRPSRGCLLIKCPSISGRQVRRKLQAVPSALLR